MSGKKYHHTSYKSLTFSFKIIAKLELYHFLRDLFSLLCNAAEEENYIFFLF